MSHCLKVIFEKILIDYGNVNIVYFDKAHPVLPIFLVLIVEENSKFTLTNVDAEVFTE